jgi:hypothetical protein
MSADRFCLDRFFPLIYYVPICFVLAGFVLIGYVPMVCLDRFYPDRFYPIGFVPIGFVLIGFIPIGFVMIGFSPDRFCLWTESNHPKTVQKWRVLSPLSIPCELALVQDLVVQFVCLSGSSFGSCRSPPIPDVCNFHSVKERIIYKENSHTAWGTCRLTVRTS